MSMKKKNLIISIILMISIICVCFLSIKYIPNVIDEKQNQSILQEYIYCLTNKKYDKLDKYIESDTVKMDTIIHRYNNIFNSIDAKNIKVKNISLKKVEDEDNKYTFSYILSFDTPLGEIKNLKFNGIIKNKKIQWKYNLIFPNMISNDKVYFKKEIAKRGNIVDRNNQLLAGDQKVLELGVIPNELGKGKEKEKRISFLCKTFELTEDEIKNKLSQKWVKDDLYVPIKKIDRKQYPNMPKWVYISLVDGRYYPLGAAAAQLIGYIGNVTAEDLKKHPELNENSVIGRAGLEYTFDKELQGHDGGKIVITDQYGEIKQTLLHKPKKDGKTIKLTIDAEAQKIAFKSLRNRPGSVVTNNPKNGELLTLVSSPSYDPNKMTNGISQKEYEKYLNNKDLPFTSRYSTGYAPGSTFKMITAAIGLDNKTIDPNQYLHISGLKWQPNSSWGGYFVTRVSDKPEVNLKDSLVYSDNIYMAQQTLKMGEEKFISGLKKFIFGESLDLPLTMNPAQISHDGKLNSEILLADTGYGQGELLINPIQQITMYTIFANQGNLVYPKLLFNDSIETKKNIVSPNSINIINRDLEAVIKDPNGTAHILDSLPFSLLGKTGTAEIKSKQDTRGQQNSFLFVMNSNKMNFSVLSFLENRKDNESATEMSIDLLNYLNSKYNY